MLDMESLEFEAAHGESLHWYYHPSIAQWIGFETRPGLRRGVDWAVGSVLETPDVVGVSVGQHNGFRRTEVAEPIETTVDQDPTFYQEAAVPAVIAAADVNFAARPGKLNPHSEAHFFLRKSPVNRFCSPLL